MASLQTLPGIGKSSVELLEAAGFTDEDSLASTETDELVRELKRANSVLHILKRAPGRADILKWQQAARQRLGLEEAEIPEPPSASVDEPALECTESPTPVNYEADPEVAALLAKAPVAQALPPQLLKASKLTVSDIPPAILLNRVVGDLDMRVTESASGKPIKATKLAPQHHPIRGRSSPIKTSGDFLERRILDKGQHVASKLEVDIARIRSITEIASEKGPIISETLSDKRSSRVELIRAPQDGTNKGRSPESRRYVRGVLHPHPYQLVFGAILTLVVILAVPLALAAAVLLALSDLKPETFAWVPSWFLSFPLVLLVSGLVYLTWGVNAGKCRICGQKLFAPKNCLKNSKAHHVPFIGYIVPTSLHLLAFRWFRCTYCGTPVRVKE